MRTDFSLEKACVRTLLLQLSRRKNRVKTTAISRREDNYNPKKRVTNIQIIEPLKGGKFDRPQSTHARIYY